MSKCPLCNSYNVGNARRDRTSGQIILQCLESSCGTEFEKAEPAKNPDKKG